VSTIEKLLQLSRDQPGFADQFDEIAGQIMVEAKNAHPPLDMSLKDQAHALAEVLGQMEKFIAGWRRQLRDTEKPT
jgi:ABC-type enterochelin transport system substrate-binding protein